MSGPREPIVVVGAGIAGATAAAALRAGGADVVVLERRREPGSGSAISLWPNALAALDRIGRGDAVRAAGRPSSTGGTRREDGRWLMRPGEAQVDRALGERVLGIRRAALVAAIAGTEVAAATRHGAVVEAVAPHGGGAVVRLAGGEELAARAVVIADGSGSTTISSIAPVPPARYAGYVGWRGIARLRVDEPATQFWGPSMEAGFLALAGDETYWFLTERLREDVPAPADGGAHVRGVLADWPAPMAALVAATPDAELLRHPVRDRRSLRRWARGPVVAIGDAAHPMRPHLAQGGCQAIEDGVLLGLLLAREPDAAPTAARFAAARRRHVGAVVRNARAIGTALHAPRPLNAAFHAGNALAPSAAMIAQLRAVASRRAFERQARRLGL